MRLVLLSFLLLVSCQTEEYSSAKDLGPYEFVAPMGVEPIYTWGDDMATEYVDSLEEARIQDSTENAGFTQWADSMARASK